MIQTSFIQMKTTKNSNPNFSFKMIQILTVNITVKRSPDLNEEKKKLKINEDEGTRLLSTHKTIFPIVMADRIHSFGIIINIFYLENEFSI